jgi:hypothetical protein
MKLFAPCVLAGAVLLLAPLFMLPLTDRAAAQTPSAVEKINAYISCINRLSGRSYQSQSRYFSWAAKSGPTGKERIIYGTYTIYDTNDCVKNVEKANALEPHDAEIEAAATAYAKAVSKLAPVLKEADEYYTQENYKDDRMAKGKALHPLLVAAWNEFDAAHQKLSAGVDAFNDRTSLAKLAELEKTEGRKARYYIESTMIEAKRVLRAENADKPDVAAISKAVADLEAAIKGAEETSGAEGSAKIGSFFMSNAKSYLTTAKQLMRRIRDKTPYSQGDKMMLNNSLSGWMVEGSPPRLRQDYNKLIDSYNSGANI